MRGLAEAGGGEVALEGILVWTGQLHRNPSEVGMLWRQVGRRAGGAPHPVDEAGVQG